MDMIGKIGLALPVLALVLLGLLASPVRSRAEEPAGRLTLTLPRRPAADEALSVRLTVGVLPRDARVVVRTADGQIAGTIRPFGVRSGQKAGVFTIPVPSKAVVEDKVSLRLEVLEKNAKAARAPTEAEVEHAELSFVPVAGAIEKGKS
jgi:hypothetical protein